MKKEWMICTSSRVVFSGGIGNYEVFTSIRGSGGGAKKMEGDA
jgi:hypothetical protein